MSKAMKKYIILTAVAVMAAFACSKVEPQADEPATTLTYCFNIAEKPSLDGATRAVKEGWTNGDIVYVVIDDRIPESSQDLLILQYSSGDWNVIQQPFNTPTSATGTLDALYYENPNPTMVLDHSSTFYFDDRVNTPEHFGSYMYLLANDVPYSVSDGKLTADLNLSFDNSKSNSTTRKYFYYLQFRIEGMDDGWWISIVGDAQNSHYFVIPKYFEDWGDNKKHKFGFETPISSSSQTWLQPYYSVPLDAKRDDGHYKYVRYYVASGIATKLEFELSKSGVGTFYKKFYKSASGNEAISFTGPVPPEGKTLAEMEVGESTDNGWKKTYN